MASGHVSNAYSQGRRGEMSRDASPANQLGDQRPHYLGANPELGLHHQQQAPSHQPMYRKRETKPGQKEKRVLKKTPNSPSSRKKHGTNPKDPKAAVPKKDNPKPAPSNKPNQQTKNNSNKKKTKKQNNKSKKKKSTLAFWFCMSSNTDAKDRSSQAAPVPKSPKSKPPPPSIEQKQDTLDRDTTLETPPEILATKYSRRHAGKRHSAPPSTEWTRIVTKAIVESPSQPPRSRTPTGGVRYRYDGTLERPYVYPGGLTFQTGVDKSWRHDAKWLEWRSNSSFCDTTMDDASQMTSCDKHDDFDVASKFYLRFDDGPTDGSHSKDRRMSTPSDFTVGEQGPLERRAMSPALETVPKPPPFAGSDHEDNSPRDQNVIYDIPYESDSDKEGENEADDDQTDGKRNSYYSKPLQNSGCIYMWHSCEDLQHCEERYHSKDGLNRICLNCKGNTPPRCHRDIHTGYGNGGDEISISSSPMASADPDVNAISGARKMSLPVGITLEYPFPDSTQRVPDSGQQTIVTPDDTHRNGHTKGEMNAKEASPVRDSPDPSQHDMATRNEGPTSPDHSKHSDSPFRRDIGRSSCMPGNKRFFLPPPPCYTPPKEEMEVALATINKVNCHRGSQTDLSEDVDQVDMEDRDLSLKREDAMVSQMTNFSLDAKTSTTVGTEKRAGEDKRENVMKLQTEMSNSDVGNEPSNNTQDNLEKSEPDQNTKPAPSVRTSTPKSSRRSLQPGEDLKVFTGPKPLPRKRIPSKDSSSSVSTPKGDSVQPSLIDSANQSADSLPNKVVVRTNKVPPVPKKRRSQMTEPDLSYTFADIEKVLAECKDSLPRGVQAPLDTPIHKDGRQDSQKNPATDERQTSPLNVHRRESGRSKPASFQTQATPSKVQSQVNTSPEHRCRLNSSLGSSIDGGHPPRRFTALSPSLDNMMDVFQERTFDPDNEDNCNADDEMSIHNEDNIYPAGTASVQNLLRSHSIFDRSLAVTRKRRQRLRDRKCHSQLLSSADIDDYDHHHKMTRGHLWKLQKCDGHGNSNRHVPVAFHWPNGGKHLLKPQQLLLERNLWKHSYTDSGNDSDMLSPIDTRDHRLVEDVVFRESSYPPPAATWKKAGNSDDVTGTPDKKPWEVRLKVKHELRKARSIEHLFLAQEAQATKKPSLETCV